MSGHTQPKFIAGRRDALVRYPRRVAIGARQGIVGHDAGPDLVGDKDHRRGQVRDQMRQRRYLGLSVHVAQHEVRQPQRQAIHQPG